MDATAINELKQKICREYNNLICLVQKGYKPDYSFILDEISLIELVEDYNIDNRKILTALQYYLHNKWQTIQF